MHLLVQRCIHLSISSLCSRRRRNEVIREREREKNLVWFYFKCYDYYYYYFDKDSNFAFHSSTPHALSVSGTSVP